ncbi:MAG: DNA polymerase III subunit [Acidobacteriota bacterium]|nr:DNA polymerase III subunit [Acidobacteriota bacterium]
MPFRDITGHRPLLKLLASAVARDSLPQSLLFNGPQGVGKFAIAMAVAQAVNCPERKAYREGAERGAGAPRATEPGGVQGTPPLAEDACGRCSSCTRIARHVHGDVILVEPGDTGSIKIEQIRDALEKVAYRPFEGRRRVIIIDQLEAAAGAAQDALLKRLEEPTSASMFILVSSQCDMLLPTVRSRCYQLRFAPLSDADVVKVLVERHKMDEAPARAAAALSDGSVGGALARSNGELTDAREIALELLTTAAGGSADQPARRLAAAKNAAASPSSRVKDRDALAARLEAAAAFLRDMQILNAGGDPSLLTNADMAGELAGLARVYGHERGLAAFAAVERALSALNRQANTKIVADWIALTL